jgi:hypothetical protein
MGRGFFVGGHEWNVVWLNHTRRAIIMDAKEKLLHENEVDAAIREAELEFAENGELIAATEALKNLRKEHFGVQ